MGLDWNPGNRAKPGFEAEHEEIIRRIESGDYRGNGDSKGGFLGLIGKSKQADKPTQETLVERFGEITSSAFETLEAPRIGHDEAATQWARRYYAEAQPDEPEEEWLESFKGLYIVSLIEDCDGVPRYSNGAPGGYVEPFSFRGQFLADCVEIIGEALLESCYQTKTPADTLAFGRELLAKAEDYVRRHHLDLDKLDSDDPESQAFKLDVVVRAGRWCVFWAERGHFLEAYW